MTVRPQVVVGAGVVGLAIARELAMAGHEVVMLEAEERIGTGVSSRNSEVIHAGLYYPPGSLKAETCVRGRELLYAYARQAGVPHRQTGKLIVATSETEVSRLDAIQDNAARCGVDDLQRLTAEEVRAMEPLLRCVAALWSPSSGIVDSHALMRQLRADIERAGGFVVAEAPVLRIVTGSDSLAPVVHVGGRAPATLEAAHVYIAAGLGSLALARTCVPSEALPTSPSRFAKGTYYTLTGRTPPFSRLVYPVPEAGGLGIHATVDLAGQVRFGPDVEWVDQVDYAPRSHRRDAFVAAVRAYWPGLPDGALVASYTGIRPKIVGPGEPDADFRILGPTEHGVGGITVLLGIESPGLTAAVALAQRTTGLGRDRVTPGR